MSVMVNRSINTKENTMGWNKWMKSIEENVIPQKEDSPGTMITKAVLGPLMAPLTFLDLLEEEPRSDRDSSRDSRSSHDPHHNSRSSGGCTCQCTCTCS